MRSILSVSATLLKQEFHGMINIFLADLGEPVAVEDRPVESFVLVDVGEVFESNHVDVFICPPSLFITNQSEKFMMNNIITKISFL